MKITPKTGQESEQICFGGQEGPTSSSEGSWEVSRQCWAVPDPTEQLPTSAIPAALLPPQYEFQSCPWLQKHIHLKSHLDIAYHRLWGRALGQQTGQERGGLEEGRQG